MFISFKDYCSSHACISCLSRTCVCVWRGGGSDVAVVELRQEGRGRSGHLGDRWGGGGGGGSSRWSGWSFCRKTKLKLVPLRSQVLHSSGFFCCFQPSIYPHPPPADEHALRRTNCTHTRRHTHSAAAQSLHCTGIRTNVPSCYSFGPTSQCKTSGAVSSCVLCWSTPDPVWFFVFGFFCTGLKSSNIQGGQRSEVYEDELL